LTLLDNGAAALAGILGGTKTADLEIDLVQLDTTGGAISPSDSGAATPTTPNPATGGLKTVIANTVTVTFTITPANNQGIWLRWWLHFRADLSEGLAAGIFTSPGIDHDGTATDVVEFDISFVEG